jgi:hypothetical protein
VSRIFKYDLQIRGTAIVPMQRGAVILHVAAQGTVPCVWASVDPNAPLESRTFSVVFTGHDDIPEDSRYLGTCQTHNGLVLHVYEMLRKWTQDVVDAGSPTLGIAP